MQNDTPGKVRRLGPDARFHCGPEGIVDTINIELFAVTDGNGGVIAVVDVRRTSRATWMNAPEEGFICPLGGLPQDVRKDRADRRLL